MQGTDSIHYMHVVNTEAVSYESKNPYKWLENVDWEKKKNYLHACLNKHWQFTPFASSVDRLLGFEAEEMLKLIAICLTTDWKEQYSRTCRYVKSILVITTVRETQG